MRPGSPIPVGRLEHLGLGDAPLVGLDFDGTLAPIVENPDMAEVIPSNRDAVRRLAEVVTVCVVSGRDPRDARERLGVAAVAAYAGSHGLDLIDAAGQPFDDPPTKRFENVLPLLDTVEERLRDRFSGVYGVVVERKRFGAATHFRQRPEAAADVEAFVIGLTVDHPSLRVQFGKSVAEIRPAIDWHKGSAITWLADRLGPFTGILYVGDDATDEDAFEAVSGRGAGILVASRPRTTAARFRVGDPTEVGRLLARLADRYC